MPNACCCYTIDEGYLLPTILSALQLRQCISPSVADVLIVCFAAPSPATDAAASYCGERGIQFQRVSEDELRGSPMICARFFLSHLLDVSYEEIIYIDGDTQVSGAIEPLAQYPLASGKVLAAPDPMAIMIDNADGPWPARKAYFRSIGIANDQLSHYFNSGVLRFRRPDWDAISRECVKLCQQKGTSFKFLDQDALNLVIGRNRAPMSFRWNFPSFFMSFEYASAIAPRVYHFMSRPRPWDGPFHPWGRPWHEPYLLLAAALPQVSERSRPLQGVRYMRYVAQQRYKHFTESSAWRSQAVCARILERESEAVV